MSGSCHNIEELLIQLWEALQRSPILPLMSVPIPHSYSQRGPATSRRRLDSVKAAAGGVRCAAPFGRFTLSWGRIPNSLSRFFTGCLMCLYGAPVCSS